MWGVYNVTQNYIEESTLRQKSSPCRRQNTHVQLLQGLNGPLVKMSWARTQRTCFSFLTSTSNLVSEVVFCCTRGEKNAFYIKNTQKTNHAIWSTFFPPSLWLPLCTPHCHRYVRFGPSWPGTAGQRRCRASPRSLGSSSWTPFRYWSGGWGAWLASLHVVKMV